MHPNESTVSSADGSAPFPCPPTPARRLRAAVRRLLPALLLAPALLPAPARASDADLASLLAGVSEIAAPGVPGPLCVFGPEAFAVAVGGAGGGTVEPVAAAGRLGAGRVAAFGHGGYLDQAALDTADTGRLMDNLIRWSAGGKPRPRVGVYQLAGLAARLSARGFTASDVALDGLAGVEVLFTPSWNNPLDEIAALQAWVRAGGGLITSATGWGWQQLNPSRDILTDFGGNQLLAPAGIAWADAYLNRTSPQGYAVPGPPDSLTHAGTALDRLLAQAGGGPSLSDAELDQASTTLTQAARCLPPADSLLLPRLRELTDNPDIDWIPSKAKPIDRRNLLGKIVLILQERDYRRDPASHRKAHPAAVFHPGAVDPSAPRVTRRLDIDASQPDWHSTGLYAAPGEAIRVRIPESALGQGLRLRIGAHADRIHGRASWHRAPAISFDWPLEATDAEFANAFGGLIYLVVPRDSQLGRVELEVEGAVEAPLFLKGRSSLADWQARIRDLPGPWAEIGSDKMIVTLPSSAIRDLDDPMAVVETWDRIMDLDAELAGLPSERLRPERIVPDVEISVGYMHAGYPIMTYDDQYDVLADAARIRGQGSWGLFHEVGHNHQSRYWTFDGTGEVTVNLFTLYVFEHLVGIPVAQHERGSEAFLAQQMAKYDFDQPDFAQWKSDPFLALAMYVQLQHAFGWEAYRAVFAAYRALPQADLPTTDDEERDQWMIRFSRQVGYDLGPFFAWWGVPVSDAARAAIAGLPDWLPAGFPPQAPEPTPPLHTPTASPPPSPTSPPSLTPTATDQPRIQIWLPFASRP
ncbi:MAG: M60 family metallopeptidase [Chloroflexi bacterium]|nr:M60 family metallopeptidase [Chloroflexota bacterium]